jgi:small subunit ribosomal protein S20
VAHHKSAIKRIRRNDRVRGRNRQYIAAVKTAVKKFKALATSSAQGTPAVEQLKAQFTAAQAALAKAGSKGILHKNNAARRISRLAHILKKAEQGKAGA